MSLAGFGPDPGPECNCNYCTMVADTVSDQYLRARAVKAARTILARHAGCRCDLCDLARTIELNLEGVTYER